MKKRVIIISFLFMVLLLVFSVYFYNIYFSKSKLIEGIVIGDTSEPAEHLHIRTMFNIEKIADASMVTGIDFTDDNKMFFSEIGGRIAVIDGNSIKEFAKVPDSQIPTVEKGEAGVYAIAIDPEFDLNKYVYVFYTSNGSGKIGRFTEVDGVGKDFEIIFDGVPQSKIHNGGDLDFGYDGKLYLSTGDATIIKNKLGKNNPAQDIYNKGGKVLRINKDGTIPKDNPFEDSYTYAYGFRNIFGFAINPVSGAVYAGDQGIDCCEELNYVKSGKNYGWALEMGIVSDSEYEDPIYAWDKEGRISPTGMSFYTGDRFPEIKNNLFLLTWRTREIYRFVLKNNEVEKVEAFAVNDLYELAPITGRHAGNIHEGQRTERGSIKTSEGLLDIVESPDGYLYFSDVRGIYRLTPK